MDTGQIFLSSPFSDTGQPNIRFINIENHILVIGRVLYEVPLMKAFENGDAILLTVY